MKHRLRSLVTALGMALVAAACGGSPTPLALPTVVISSDAAPAGGGVTASGEVIPEPKAELSFPLTGIVKTVEVKVGDKVAAGEALVTLDAAIWEARIKEAEGELAQAQANERWLVRSGDDQEHIDAANADVERATAAVESAKATLLQATLTAPFSGTIAAVDISPGETVTPGLEVIMLGDLSNFQVVTTDLSERDVPTIQVGQSATISVMALGEDFPATVSDIARVSSTVGGDVVYEVTLQFDRQPQGLLWGMTAEVQINTAP